MIWFSRYITAIAVALVLAAATSTASAADRFEAIDRTALRVCADPASPPLSTEDGKGFENVIAELLAHDLGVPVRYTWFPSTMGFFRRTLNARNCDIVLGVATGIELAQSTIPYYRSTYVLVTRKEDGIAATRLDDPALRSLRLGVQARTPAADVLARAGMLGNIRSYDLMVDSRHTSVGQQLVNDLAEKRIDAAVLWGPIAAHLADTRQGAFMLTPLSSAADDVPLAFDISMAVRFGEPAWRARVERFIRDRRQQIHDILVAYRVPLLPLPGGDW